MKSQESLATSRSIILDFRTGLENSQVMGDRESLVQLLVNLLDNAIKYSVSGDTVVVELKQAGDFMNVAVIDEGPGIPEEDQSRIFERFYRVDPARSKELGGTGLGLSIVKHIASTHGGEITVQSKVGAGSTFTLSLPKLG